MPGKFVGYFRLLDSCARPGCPVCGLVTDDSRNYLDALLYEQVTDPDTRRALRASWGFCNWHAWMLLEVQNSFMGSAIIYEDLVGSVIDRVRRLAPWRRRDRLVSWLPFAWGRRRSALLERYRRRRTCPACTIGAAAEDRYLETMVKLIHEPDLQLAYMRSDGLCVPHVLRALEVADGGDEAGELLDRTLTKWARLRGDLESFVRKHDYQNTEPYTEAETTSYTRAFELLTGARGVFGNDFHAVAASDLRPGSHLTWKPATDG